MVLALLATGIVAATALSPCGAALAQSRAGAAEPDVPYVPTPSHVVDAMLDLAQLEPDDFLIDLGSGDGRIAIAAGRRGARALGIERDSDLVARATGYARGEGVEQRVRFRRQDMFAAPIREASVVTLYLLPEANLRLRPKLLTELRPGARVVSHAFAMGDWGPDARRVVDGRTLYLWIVPAPAGGRWRLTLADGSTHLLELEQRFQQVGGTLDGHPVAEAALHGVTLSFTAALPSGARSFRGMVMDSEIRSNPAEPGSESWIAQRID